MTRHGICDDCGHADKLRFTGQHWYCQPCWITAFGSQ